MHEIAGVSRLMYDNFYPRTRHLANRLIDWLQKRPTLHRFALNLAKRHDKAMGYRKFGISIPFILKVYIVMI